MYIREAKYVLAFTGAGISVESGVAPFRGKGGLWNDTDPKLFYIDHFMESPKETWELLVEHFYNVSKKAEPNAAHTALAELEKGGLLHSLVTQNIDNLHTLAGSKIVHEFHGNLFRVVCTKTGTKYPVSNIDFSKLPPYSKQGGLLKPDIVFFGEAIPPDVYAQSFAAAKQADVVIVIGTTGEVYPAASIPMIAKENGAKIIEVNTEDSEYSNTITDIFLRGKAGQIMSKLQKLVIG